MIRIATGSELELVRVIAKFEPGGAQLGAMRLTRALADQGVRSRLLIGEATAAGLRQLRAAGVPFELWGEHDGDLQYACEPHFAAWLQPRLVGTDLVHAHMFGGWWAASQAVPPSVPLVASEHNALRWPGPAPISKLRRALERVDAFCAHGPASRATMLQLGIPPTRLVDATSAIEPAVLRPLADLPVPRLVFAGRMHQEKGPDLLLEALSLLRAQVPAYLLGDGPLLPALRRRAVQLGLGPQATFTGWQDQVGSWLAGASVCVVPSRAEAWSQTAVTAMAHRVPVIATSVEGLPLTLADRRGVLVAPEDPAALALAIAAVLDGPGDVDLDAARRYAARFHPDRVATQYSRLYRRLLGTRRTAGIAA
jgi:glycosyltransferase involved in cell wall biosynthesis